MKTEIFYFTGTGNSLWVAKKILENLSGATVHSIISEGESVKFRTDGNIVIVTPVYMYNFPKIVVDFMKSIEGAGTCSIALTCGGESGQCNKVAKELFADKQIELKSIFNFPIASNYAPYGLTDEHKVEENYAAFHSRISGVCKMIEEGETFFDNTYTNFFQRKIHPGILYSMGYKYLNYLGKNFYADDKCDGCGICSRICPVDNILMKENKPQWENHCQQCFACLQWCPPEAIQFGKKTSSIGRYHCKEITLHEIITSNNTEKKEHS